MALGVHLPAMQEDIIHMLHFTAVLHRPVEDRLHTESRDGGIEHRFCTARSPEAPVYSALTAVTALPGDHHCERSPAST